MMQHKAQFHPERRNKDVPFWFQARAAASCIDESAARLLGAGQANIEASGGNGNQLASRLCGREGDERLSATDETAARRPAKDKSTKSRGSRADDGLRRGNAKGADKHPPGELGRALKTVYDDTLREEVPKDFLDLLGKLS